MAENPPNVGHAPGDNARRDAIHVAMLPVVAGERLAPGEHVAINADGQAVRHGTMIIGYVDPELGRRGIRAVEAGERFWLWLYQGTVTSLRHEWTHPTFPTPEYAAALASMNDRAFSERWLRDYAVRLNCEDEPEAAFLRLLESLRSGEFYSHGSTVYGEHDLDDADELKRHAEAYLGIRINWGDFTFSCGC